MQDAEIKAEFSEQAARALKELMKRNPDSVNLLITNDDILFANGERFKNLVKAN